MKTASRMINGEIQMWIDQLDLDHKICVPCKARHSLWDGFAVIASFRDPVAAFQYLNEFTDEEILELVKLNFEMWDMEPSIKRKPVSNKIVKLENSVLKRAGIKES